MSSPRSLGGVFRFRASCIIIEAVASSRTLPFALALYSGVNYQGTCAVYSTTAGHYGNGIYDSGHLGALADNSAASIQVGANVMASLYDLNYANGAFNGRPETFDSSDAGLGGNRIGIGRVSTLVVKPAAAPALPTLVNPPKTRADRAADTTDSLVLSWDGGEGGVDYQVELTYPDNSRQTSPWLQATAWSIGSLPAGGYSWKVTARNRFGAAVSNPASFTVATASLTVLHSARHVRGYGFVPPVRSRHAAPRALECCLESAKRQKSGVATMRPSGLLSRGDRSCQSDPRDR